MSNFRSEDDLTGLEVQADRNERDGTRGLPSVSVLL